MSMLDVAGAQQGSMLYMVAVLRSGISTSCCQLKVLLALANVIINAFVSLLCAHRSLRYQSPNYSSARYMLAG
jgi:hypothetical protein